MKHNLDFAQNPNYGEFSEDWTRYSVICLWKSIAYYMTMHSLLKNKAKKTSKIWILLKVTSILHSMRINSLISWKSSWTITPQKVIIFLP